MSKKKSYMDNKNIIKEGFFDTLVRAIIPKSIQQKVDANAKKYYDKESKKLDNELENLQKQSDELRVKFLKAMEKQYDFKPNSKKVKDFINKKRK